MADVNYEMVLNGQGGDIFDVLQSVNGDPGYLRPYWNEKGKAACTIRTGVENRKNSATGEYLTNADGSLKQFHKSEEVLIKELYNRGMVTSVMNATTLRKDEWIRLDEAVMKAARQRLRAWSDLRSANTFGGFDAMANPILEHETVSDPGEAVVSMDGLSGGRNARPKFGLEGLPLPITHSDFFMSSRFLAASRNKGVPASTLQAEMAGRRVAESIEQTLIGTLTGVTYGDSTDYGTTAKVYGYTNHPDRNTKTNLTASASFVADTFVNEVIAMRELAYADNHYGPFMLYVSTAYDAKLDQDYVTGTAANGLAAPSGTVRDRVRRIDGISDVRRLDYLTGDVLLLVQMTSDVAEAINGMEISTIQWDTTGGMQKNFKVLGIQVPRLRSDYSGTSGIVHATTA